EMAVVDELPSLRPGGRQARSPDDVVQAALEDLEQVVAGDTGTPLGHLVVAPELTLQNAVHDTELLLLPELDLVVALADSAPTVFTGRVGTAIDRALLRLTQRSAGPAARLVLGSGVTSHDQPLR